MKIAKWGNSLAVRIPRNVAQALGVQEGDDVELVPVDSSFVGLARRMTREEALDRLRQFRGRMPADYKFDREEANAR